MSVSEPSAPGFLGTLLSFSLHPGKAFALPPKQRSRWNPFLFAIVANALGHFSAALSSFLVEGTDAAVRDLVLTAISPLSTLVQLTVFGAILHALLRLVGVRGAEYGSTVHVLALSSGPALLAGIPLAGPIVSAIWGLVIAIVGLSVVHATSKLRAVVAMLALPIGSVLLAVGLRVFVLEAFKIPSRGMSPALEPGDHIFVSKFDTNATYGDVIVFPFPEHPDQDFVKRVVARGGDQVRVVSGHPIINDWPVPWCEVGDFSYDEGSERRNGKLYVEFLGKRAYYVFLDRGMRFASGTCSDDTDCKAGFACDGGECLEQQGPYEVPPGSLFVMGDNRLNSHDSRGWFQGSGGYVEEGDVRGKASIIWMSFAPGGRIDWRRVGGDAQGFTALESQYERALEGKVEACLAHRSASSTPPKR